MSVCPAMHCYDMFYTNKLFIHLVGSPTIPRILSAAGPRRGVNSGDKVACVIGVPAICHESDEILPACCLILSACP